MQVILLAKVPGLGDIDAIVDVADGYAANFLFPRNLAISASTKALNDLKIDRARRAKEAERELKETQSIASRLDGFSATIAEKVNEAGFLYAAVGPQKVAEALAAQGFEISKNQIQIKQPYKQPGEYDIKIKFKHGLEATMHLIIEGKKK